MKTIGNDISLDVCKAEGYTMIQYDARKKFNPDSYYRIFAYVPDYCEGIAKNTLITDVRYTFSELMELYDKYRDAVNSFAETDKFINFDKPDYYDFLNLASDLLAYCGLD